MMGTYGNGASYRAKFIFPQWNQPCSMSRMGASKVRLLSRTRSLPHPRHVLSPQSPAVCSTAFHCVTQLLPCPSSVTVFLEMPSVLQFLWAPCLQKRLGLCQTPSPHSPLPQPLFTPAGTRDSFPRVSSVLSSYCLHLSQGSTNICVCLSLPLNPELCMTETQVFSGWMGGWPNNSPKPKNGRDELAVNAFVLQIRGSA